MVWYQSSCGLGRVGKTSGSANYKKFLHRPRELECLKKDIFSVFGYGCFAFTNSVLYIYVSLNIGTGYFVPNSNKIYYCSKWYSYTVYFL